MRILPGIPLDVTMPDDTVVPTGETFVKTWKLINGGSCSWTTAYSLSWFSGELLSSARSYPLLQTIAPGETLEISVEMTAPTDPGTYQSNWKLLDPNGNLYGIGPAGNSPFWVRIKAVSSATQPPPPVTSTLNAGSGIDLSSKASTTDAGQADLWLEDGQLAPTNGALMGLPPAGLPDRATCAELVMADSPIVLADNVSRYYCLVDRRGNPGWIQVLILASDPLQWGVQYQVWEP